MPYLKKASGRVYYKDRAAYERAARAQRAAAARYGKTTFTNAKGEQRIVSERELARLEKLRDVAQSRRRTPTVGVGKPKGGRFAPEPKSVTPAGPKARDLRFPMPTLQLFRPHDYQRWVRDLFDEFRRHGVTGSGKWRLEVTFRFTCECDGETHDSDRPLAFILTIGREWVVNIWNELIDTITDECRHCLPEEYKPPRRQAGKSDTRGVETGAQAQTDVIEGEAAREEQPALPIDDIIRTGGVALPALDIFIRATLVQRIT